MSQDLARRAVACPRWQWMPGMRIRRDGVPYRIVSTWRYEADSGSPDPSRNWCLLVEDVAGHACVRVPEVSISALDMDLPDLDAPSTVGCLLALVREAHGRPDLHACPMFSLHTGDLVRWRVAIDEHMAYYGPTEAAALVAALEAA